jgi:hypothetical protein
MKNMTAILSLLILSSCSNNKFEVQLVVSLPPSVDHAVQFSVIDYNVVEKFIKEFDTLNLNTAILSSATAADNNALITNSIMKNWDALFNDIPATDYWLMNNADSATYSKTGGIFIPLSNKWWVASKAFLIGGKPYCYVIPLQIIKGSRVSCKPDQNNLFSLTDIYQKQIQKK